MREVPQAEILSHSSPPYATPETPPAGRCDAQKCPWWPYTSSRDFKINTTLVLVFLFCTVIFALIINLAIRYIIALRCVRRRRRRIPIPIPIAANRRVEMPWAIYSEGMKLAGTEAVCAICLSEIAVGERISVVEKCGHGFHVECIQRWLASHSSCPTCRANC
ncbi:RING-H2 finger protein ATL79-like [Andrographis paniculata]|uniref:RING-H2 finger protein ATL79-like n=1 Tax=Andrographis paniculata TaxID=175694 RepID=UPI0021E6E0D7|nr:RING-H2 finger protein ATL79-like [Andrographis paniculata]